MRGVWIPLSAPRRFVGDLMHLAARVPTVPVQRRMRLGEVAAARARAAGRPSWATLFIKGYSLVEHEMPVLRRAYVALPWPHLYEYPTSVASVAVEREYRGEPGVFFGHVWDANYRPLAAVQADLRRLTDTPVEEVPAFRSLIRFTRLPRPVRRLALWLGLNMGRLRPGRFGTFALSVYSALGAESLHPLSPLTAAVNYGVIGPDGAVDVRIVYDHRVLDGATVARALAKLEAVLTGAILDELRAMADPGRAAA